jgi:hypothetical protein
MARPDPILIGMFARTPKQWAILVLPLGVVTGFTIRSYQQSKIEEALYEEAMFQQIAEERKQKK